MEKRKIQAEIDSYQTKTPKSLEMQRKASRYLPGGSSRGTAYFDPYPHFIERGKGSYVYDVDGNKYLDFMINATSLILGHANRHISAVIKDQIDLGAAYSGPTESQINLAEIREAHMLMIYSYSDCENATSLHIIKTISKNIYKIHQI